MKFRLNTIPGIAAAAVVATVVFSAGWLTGNGGQDLPLLQEAEAAGGIVKAPNVVAPDRYVYYPGTEVLAKDEVRVIACGTGLPAARRSQAATCFLIEAGNGEKYLFDIGTGSMGNIASLMIPYQYLFFNEEATRYGMYEGIRATYDGPLSLATDMMVWNVTKDSITERMAVSVNEAWSVPGTAKQPPPEKGRPNPSTEYIEKGRWIPAFKAQDAMLDRYMSKYNLEKQDWRPAMYKALEGD